MDKAQILEQTLHDKIPISRAMGIKVAYCDELALVLSAPLQPNVNHMGSAFAGSVYSAAVLAGWAWLYLRLEAVSCPAHVVIHESNIIYHAPITGDFKVECKRPSPHEFSRFHSALDSKGKARITLHPKIIAGGKIAATLVGSYVAYS